jgi:sulfoxide reductase heme-binding subunit YedZ
VNEALWYTSRGSGTVALILLTVVVVLGVGSRSGRPVFGLPRFGVSAVHNNASLIAIGLTAIHMVTLWLDPLAQIRLLDLVVPFDAVYRPFWVGLGTVAMDLLLLIWLSTVVRHRIGVRLWRGIHWTSYAIWPIALLHTLFSGTDAAQLWLRVIAGGCLLLFCAAVIWRLSYTDAGDGRPALRTGPARPVDRAR